MSYQQMVLQQLMDQSMMSDFANTAIRSCWHTCFDSKLKREDLINGNVSRITPENNTCIKRCIDRYFEVYGFLGEARERRDQEQQMGLP
eukprot:CAMPEP_0201506964 /NCGR_PEP_ID=MMETSP0161_2-20130828/789_1 /ASSEMBLY_ACC=CAM_ASM_000251 /TAXON_ID=180227 /ORGANISM="Neoparamoeba aestuarina, Strain SoJaBio B1-5/56/2" /LENGTH=88 /DNA_ID=CAMNT_0047901215 /DNA_START=27 /DNA_END=289 /DNA_ORIENTATION=-